MKEVLVGVMRCLVAAAAVVVAATSMVSLRADASTPGSYPHSCYAGCCDTCRGGLCCFDEPPLPDPDRVPAPFVPQR